MRPRPNSAKSIGRRSWLGVLGGLGLLACAQPQKPPPPATPAAAPAAPQTDGFDEALKQATVGVENPALAAVLREHWEWTLQRRPLFATSLGVHRFDDRLADGSKAAIEAGWADEDRFVAAARAVPTDGLSQADAETRDLFVATLVANAGTRSCLTHTWNVSSSSTPVSRFGTLPDRHRIETVADGDNLIARYGQIPKAVDDTIALLREGAAAGRYANAESTRRALEMMERQLDQPNEQWALMAPAKAPRPMWAARDVSSFRERMAVVMDDDVRAAFVRYRNLLRDEILPHARSAKQTGVGALGLSGCYEALVKRHTTLPMTPKEVHDIGRREIARIDKEIRKLGRRALKKTSLPAVLGALRSDRALYFDTEDAVQAEAEAALAAAKAKVPEFFGITPATDCVVQRIPAYEAPFTTIAYYRQPHADGSKPGEYFVNVHQPQTRPRFEARVLAVHESIPGHHLQIAIAMERSALPAFRRHEGYTVFVEGWALYTERLAEQMGLYRDDMDRLGMLSFDAWRAGRLVVDTGIHALGWSRERAEKFLLAHTALTPDNIANEVDRYIVWPGQALGYKIGQRELLAQRKRVKKALGKRFDIRAWHDLVLGAGAVTLPVLRARVDRFLADAEAG